MKRFRSGLGLTLVLLLVLGALAGWWWHGQTKQGRYRDLPSALYIMGVIKTSYYQPVSLTRLARFYWQKGTLAGMLKALNDPYSRFLSRTEYAELSKETKGSFGGIGVILNPQEDQLIISQVVSGSPGAQAGLREGDQITQVNRVTVKELHPDVAVAKIRGPVGTRVWLRVRRNSGFKLEELDFTIIRGQIIIPTVETTISRDPLLGRYATIKLHQFANTTPADLERELTRLDPQTDIRGLVLDLRTNPGGSLDAALKVASEFLPQGTPLLHIYSRGRLIQTVKAEYHKHRYLPMVVLVDGLSASAAEIVAGALKDQGRALLIGTPTFGKDLIQEIEELPGGAAVTITVANYRTAGGVNIHHRGVQPDRVVEIKGALDQFLKSGNKDPYLKMHELQDQAARQALRELLQITRNKLAG